MSGSSRPPRIILGLTGGIACYKVCAVASQLVQDGVVVDVAMTDAAQRFVTPLTLASLTGRAVFDSQWSFVEDHDPQHIHLAREADAMLIAPCTMDMLAKLSTGRTDDPVSLLASAIDRQTTPVILAPSMNATMLQQPATERNVAQLTADGFTILEPAEGWQACRTSGKGRMPEPECLLEAIRKTLKSR
jgi:phosphopantothenoylcysteine decarboxylase/phosphopantothenate--cysteine ligase